MKPAPLFLVLAIASASADTLMPLGDEFNDPATLARWSDIDETEGWVLSTDESADISVTTPGHFRIVPKAMGWFANLRGVLFYKEVTGDFIATMKVRVLSRHNPANPAEVPNRFYSLTGIFIHEPRPFITHAAPVPYRTDSVWPPAAFGSDYVPNTENYIFLSYGTAGNPGTRQFEIKTTRNSNSILYFNSTGVPQATNEAWVQLVRVGNTVVCLRKYTEGGPWIVENRYPNPDHPFPAFGSTLQVGITAYTDWQNSEPYYNAGIQGIYHFNCARPTVGTPDLISEADYFRLQRPAPALTEAVLQGMATSYNAEGNFTANPPVLLGASPNAAPHLGDNANVPLGLVSFGAAQFSGQEGGAVTVLVRRSGASLDRPLAVGYQTNVGTAGAGDFTSQSGTLVWAANDPAEKAVIVPVAVDGTIEGEETFTLTLSAPDGPATFAGSAPSVAVPVTIAEHPFDAWRAAEFGGAANTAAAAPNADADGDGLDTLLEHVFHTHPLVGNEAEALPKAVVEGSRAGLRLACAATPGVRLEVQQSAGAGGWSAVAVRVAGAEAWTTSAPGFDLQSGPAAGEVRILAPASAGRVFLRLLAVVE